MERGPLGWEAQISTMGPLYPKWWFSKPCWGQFGGRRAQKMELMWTLSLRNQLSWKVNGNRGKQAQGGTRSASECCHVGRGNDGLIWPVGATANLAFLVSTKAVFGEQGWYCHCLLPHTWWWDQGSESQRAKAIEMSLGPWPLDPVGWSHYGLVAGGRSGQEARVQTWLTSDINSGIIRPNRLLFLRKQNKLIIDACIDWSHWPSCHEDLKEEI